MSTLKKSNATDQSGKQEDKIENEVNTKLQDNINRYNIHPKHTRNSTKEKERVRISI